MTRNKTTTAIPMLLILTFAILLVALPTTNAHTPKWELQTWAFLAVAPNPVGVGQNVFVNMWVDKPMPGASVFNDIRRHDYQLTITDPQGKNETHTFDLSDTTGVQFYIFVPDQVGVYSFVFYYPGQVYTWNQANTPGLSATDAAFENDTFKPATSKTEYLTVQQEPLPDAINSYPLPTEYWTRPIEGQNTDWWSISSNYMSGAGIIDGAVQPFGSAPNSPHIMWTKPLQFGGLVGGGNTGINGMSYYTGLSYETKFTGTIIMNGRLYYPLPKANSPSANGYACVDLHTGEEIYRSDMPMPSFGQIEWFDSENQHGAHAYLWSGSGSTRQISDPMDGTNLFNITGVPSGTMKYGPNGEILIYVLDVNHRWLALWNFTACFPEVSAMSAYRPVGKVIDGSNAYSWNVTIQALPTGSSVRYIIIDDLLLFSNLGTTYSRYGTRDPYTVGVISLKPVSRGSISWMMNYTATQPQANTIGATRYWLTTDPVNRVFMLRDAEPMTSFGYSLDDGSLLWTYQQPSWAPDWEYFLPSGFTAYGILYYCGYGGVLYAWDTKNGSLLWTYGNGGEDNSTNTGLQTPWGLYPQSIGTIADGKVYLFSTEHSPNQPLYKDIYVRCINATTGEEVWKIMSWCNPSGFSAPGIATADGYIAYLNVYDLQIYVIGKGPSALTVEAPKAAITQGSSLVVSGTVTDIAAGTKQNEQAARFPNGVPVVSDASQGAWMEYVYMQKPRPSNATGVPVTIDVIDSNGNYRNIGTTTSDANGFFSFQWTPDIPGKYTVIATFAGSNSYWPSHAETAFAVDPAPEATPVPTPTPASMSEMYFLPAVAGIIVAIAVVGAVIVLMLRKRP
jgi:hypothetical protein